MAQDLDRRLFANEAVYQLHLANPAYRSCDGNLDGALQPDELLCYDALPIKASDLPPPPVRTGTPIIDASVEAAAARTAVVAGARQEAAPDPLAASNKAFLLVRRSRSAIGSSPSRSDRLQAPSRLGQRLHRRQRGLVGARHRRGVLRPLRAKSCVTIPTSTR